MARFCQVLPGFARFCQVLPGCTRFLGTQMFHDWSGLRRECHDWSVSTVFFCQVSLNSFPSVIGPPKVVLSAVFAFHEKNARVGHNRRCPTLFQQLYFLRMYFLCEKVHSRTQSHRYPPRYQVPKLLQVSSNHCVLSHNMGKATT